MERLTAQWGSNDAVPTRISLDFAFDLDDATCSGLTDIFNRLAAYEGTGLEPEEVLGKEYADEVAMSLILLAEYRTLGPVDKLRELVHAKQDGRLVVQPPPAREGDPKPECFYNDRAGIWCLGFCSSRDDEPIDRCKRCWYCENRENSE